MYHATEPHDLHCMSQLARYESDEEDVSESDHAFSPVDSQPAPGALDSDLSADESSIPDVDPHLLSPYCPGKDSRPVSMDTVKRSSGATLVGDSFLLDQNDGMVVELPPTVYVPQPESKHQHLSRSASGASVFSDDEPADLLVAEKVTYMEPHTRPNVIIISPFAGQSGPGPGPDPGVSARRSQEMKRAYRNSSVNSMGEIEIPQQEPADDASLANISEDRDMREREDEHARLPPIDTTTPTPPDSSDTDLSPRAVLPEHTTAASDLPATHAISPQPQPSQRPISFSRPFADKTGLPTRPRLAADTSRRPASVRSTSSASTGLYTPSAPDSPYPAEDTRSRAGSSTLNLALTSTMSNSSSPVPNYSSPTFYRDRTGSAYSTTTTTTASSCSTLGMGTGTGRSPYLLRNQAVKHSAAASTSAASLRAGSDGSGPGPEEKSLKKKASRGKSLRRMRHKSGLGPGPGPEDDSNGNNENTGEGRERDQRHGSLASSSSSSSLKGFGLMGLGKLGRKKTTLLK